MKSNWSMYLNILATIMESERENSELAHAILVTNVKISENEDELEQHVHCIRAAPKRGRYWEIHPLRPRDFPRPSRFPSGLGKSLGRRGWISQYLPRLGGARIQSLSINFSSGSGSRNPFVDCPRDTLCFPTYYVIIVIAVTPSHKKMIDQLHR